MQITNDKDQDNYNMCFHFHYTAEPKSMRVCVFCIRPQANKKNRIQGKGV